MMLAYSAVESTWRRQLPASDDTGGDRRPQAKGRGMMRMMRAWTTAAILGSALVVAGSAASAERVIFQFGWLPRGVLPRKPRRLVRRGRTRRSASARQGIDRCADQDCDWRRRYGRRRPGRPAHRESAERDSRHGGDGDLYQGARCAGDDDGERHQDAEGCPARRSRRLPSPRRTGPGHSCCG